MRVGVAIPAHKAKLHLLQRCLNSIERQTRLPDMVAISISGCDSFALPTYSFPIQLVFSLGHQNASTNRNKAARLLDTDIIRFFDCDDEMLPHCLEYIERAFQETDSVMVLHNFVLLERDNQEVSVSWPDYACYPGAIEPNNGWIGCIVREGVPIRRLAHGHVSVLREIWQQYPFDEVRRKRCGEDCVFCEAIVKAYPGRCAYISTELTVYHHYE